MLKSKILFFLCLCFANKAFSLTCYTSNFSLLISGNIQNLTHKLQDCLDFIGDLSSTPSPTKQQLNCFTVTADYLDIEFKGCIPEGDCNNMSKAFKQLLQTSGAATADAIGNVDCVECTEDKCNADDTFLLTNDTVWELPVGKGGPTSDLPATPVEVADNVTEKNRQNHSAVKWKSVNIYLLLYSVYLFR